jgi:hypothetical protein
MYPIRATQNVQLTLLDAIALTMLNADHEL